MCDPYLISCANNLFCSDMPPRKRTIIDNPTASNSAHTGPLENDTPYPNMHNQFQQMMQTMLDQQHQANENQARLQEQMVKKDEDHAREMAQMQRQLLEVLERRPEPAPAQPLGPQIVINNRENEPNALFERFRNRAPKEFTGHKDPLAADDWLEHTENIFEVFRCTGRQQVQLTASLSTDLANIWWKTVEAEYRTVADAEA